MASTEAEKTAAPPEETPAPALETEKVAPPPEAQAPPPEAIAPVEARPLEYFVVGDVILRVLLFASTLASVVVMVTSNQTKLLPVPLFPFPVPVPAKFTHSPAFIYFVAALSAACLHSVDSSFESFLTLLKPSCHSKLLFHFVIVDVLFLGIVASATGAAGGVAYIGLKGNSHVRWQKVCNVYDKFCQHLGGSSLFASVVLLLLVILSIFSLSRKIPK